MTNTVSREINIIDEKLNKYVSSPSDILHSVETQLFQIFEEEMRSEKSVILSYKNEAIRKLAKFMIGEIKRSASIGIAGETASGKSTITVDIIDTIEMFANIYSVGSVITRVNTDDYYYDRSEEVKKAGGIAEFAKNYDFDVPEALELDLMCKHINQLQAGNSVMLPKYDMSGTTIRTDNHTLAKPSRIIISEGLFTLTEKIRGAFDFKIYVDIDRDVQKDRWFTRALERGFGDNANDVYKNANEKAEIYIRPCREEADIVLSGEAQRSGYKLFLTKILLIIENLYFQNR